MLYIGKQKYLQVVSHLQVNYDSQRLLAIILFFMKASSTFSSCRVQPSDWKLLDVASMVGGNNC